MPDELPPIARFLKAQWRKMKDGELRLVFPPGQHVWSAIRKDRQWLMVDPGGFRMPFKIDFKRKSGRHA